MPLTVRPPPPASPRRAMGQRGLPARPGPSLPQMPPRSSALTPRPASGTGRARTRVHAHHLHPQALAHTRAHAHRTGSRGLRDAHRVLPTPHGATHGCAEPTLGTHQGHSRGPTLSHTRAPRRGATHGHPQDGGSLVRNPKIPLLGSETAAQTQNRHCQGYPGPRGTVRTRFLL